MSRHCFFMQVNSGSEEEYKRRHDEIWPELTAVIVDAGIRNYSIFRKDNMLVGYFECEDFSRSIESLNASSVMKEWGEYMTPLMSAEIDPETSFPEQGSIVWSLDESDKEAEQR